MLNNKMQTRGIFMLFLSSFLNLGFPGRSHAAADLNNAFVIQSQAFAALYQQAAGQIDKTFLAASTGQASASFACKSLKINPQNGVIQASAFYMHLFSSDISKGQFVRREDTWMLSDSQHINTFRSHPFNPTTETVWEQYYTLTNEGSLKAQTPFWPDISLDTLSALVPSWSKKLEREFFPEAFPVFRKFNSSTMLGIAVSPGKPGTAGSKVIQTILCSK